MCKKVWEINDDVLWSTLKINEDSSFEELITKISDYVYTEIKLDARFEVEKWLKDLLEREMFLSITKKRHRDHLLHACKIALLGEKILKGRITYNNKNFRLLDLVRELFKLQGKTKNLFERYESGIVDNNEDFNDKILQIWYIAALFHDVGFIYEAFTEVWDNINFLKDFPNFEELYLGIEAAITKFQKEFSVSDVHKDIYKAEFSREFDHSKIGACIISNLVGESNLICDTAAYITDNHSSNECLKFSERPLSFLLVVLDEIQEWMRPVLGKKLSEKARLEKISNLSPYIERAETKPELNSITLSSDNEESFELNIDETGNLDLNFTLDYGDNISILDETNFSFPMMLYLKYKNLQRLRISDKGKLKEALREVLGDDGPSDLPFNFSISLNFKSHGATTEKWRQQCNILLYETTKNKNSTIKNWLNDNIKYKTGFKNEGGIRFKINEKYLPRVIDGDFSEVIMNGHIAYLQQENIGTEMLNAEFTYQKTEDDNKLKWSTQVKRKIKNNSDPKMLIEGFFISFAPESPYEYELKKVDELGSSYDANGKKVYDLGVCSRLKDTWQSTISKKVDDRERYEETLVIYIPFIKPLHYDPKEIESKVDFKIPSTTSSLEEDKIYNISRNYTIEKGKITVKWDKELFDKFFGKGGIRFNGTPKDAEELQKDIREIREEILENGEYEKSLRERYSAYEGYHPKAPPEKDYYLFEYPQGPGNFKEIKPHCEIGFIWI